jgi:twitching motility protein PilI
MARAAKLDLRAFQQELAARLAAKTTQQVEQSRLGLACAGRQWLIRLADAGEVIAVPTLATVPLTRPWYLGISNIRGNLYSVIDFAGFHRGADRATDSGRGAGAVGPVRAPRGRIARWVSGDAGAGFEQSRRIGA